MLKRALFYILLSLIYLPISVNANDIETLFNQIQIESGLWHDIFSVDLDGDGDIDNVAAGTTTTDEISWFENDDQKRLLYHKIDTTISGAYSVYATDLNQDGHQDILALAHNGDGIVWYENNGHNHFIKHIIAKDNSSADMIYAMDLDQDGDKDIIVSCKTQPLPLIVYKNNGKQSFTKQSFAPNDV